MLDPEELNTHAGRGTERVFDSEQDLARIQKYLSLDERVDRQGPPTIAIRPAWHSPRIVAQHGCFTLHGSREFSLTAAQARSLACIPIAGEAKAKLLKELAATSGVSEMILFPEPEHLCNHLKRAAGLAD